MDKEARARVLLNCMISSRKYKKAVKIRDKVLASSSSNGILGIKNENQCKKLLSSIKIDGERLKCIGAGYSKLVFKFKDLVIKFRISNRPEIEEEIKLYNFIKNNNISVIEEHMEKVLAYSPDFTLVTEYYGDKAENLDLGYIEEMFLENGILLNDFHEDQVKRNKDRPILIDCGGWTVNESCDKDEEYLSNLREALKTDIVTI